MPIYLVSGTAEGDTPLSAFHNALKKAGVHRYNWLLYTSVLPRGSEIVSGPPPLLRELFGAQAYGVMAHMEQTEKGRRAATGLGWVLDEEGKGYVFEHAGLSYEGVDLDIDRSLRGAVRGDMELLGDLKFDKKIEEIECRGSPVGAFVAVIYKIVPIEFHAVNETRQGVL